MKAIGIVCLLAGAVLVPMRAAAALPAAFTQQLAQAGVPPSAVSVLVVPLRQTGNAMPPDRLSHRADAPMNPASVMKLVTTYAGLELLGPDFTWTNRVYVDGAVKDGVLDGDLVLRGSGDPKLVLERLDELLRQVIAQGVREVRGDIVLDRSIFELPTHNPAAFDDEPLRPYNAAPDGLLVNFKALLLRFAPDADGGRVRIASEPPIAGVDIPTELALAPGPCGDWRQHLRADFSSPQRVRFGGRYPTACGERVWPVAYVEPHSYATRVVAAMWQSAGGRLDGRVREAATPATARPWVSAASLPLADIVADINKFSNNVMAQQLFLTLSSQVRARGSFEASRQRVDQWWRERFEGQPAPVLDNGSGLSRNERVSARALAALLQRAATGPQAEAFIASLGLAGVDGTVSRMGERQPASGVAGNARLKTGSLRDVAAVAGYATGRSGQRYCLVVMVNHENAAAARPALDRLVEWVVRDQP